MEEQPTRPPYRYDDEITLKELILKVREFVQELLYRWHWIALIALPFVAYQAYDTLTTTAVYPARLTLMVDEDEGSRLGGLANVLGQFGISGVQRGKYNLDKILEISRSRRVLQMALFSRSNLRGTNDYLANHIIRAYGLHQHWAEDTTGLKDFLYTHGDVDQFNATDYKVLKILQGILNGTEKQEAAYQTSYSEDTGIMTMVMSAPEESLSIALVDTIFSKLTTYYIANSIEKAEATYDVMKFKTDSLAQALKEAEYRLAEFIDRNKNIYSAREGSLRQSRLTAEVQRLQIMHGEALKNMEYADFALRNKTPFITLIDNPLPPIRAQRPSLLRALVLGLALGVGLGAAFVLGRKIYRDAMQ